MEFPLLLKAVQLSSLTFSLARLKLQGAPETYYRIPALGRLPLLLLVLHKRSLTPQAARERVRARVRLGREVLVCWRR